VLEPAVSGLKLFSPRVNRKPIIDVDRRQQPNETATAKRNVKSSHSGSGRAAEGGEVLFVQQHALNLATSAKLAVNTGVYITHVVGNREMLLGMLSWLLCCSNSFWERAVASGMCLCFCFPGKRFECRNAREFSDRAAARGSCEKSGNAILE